MSHHWLSSAEQPESQHKCAGVGDIDAVAHICYDCAVCLCVDDKFITMPRFALSNAMWLGRQHPLLQNASLGLRLLLGLGRACFKKLVFWEPVAKRTASLVLQVTMSWSRRGLHHLVRYCLHPRAISAIASWPSLAKIKKI